MNLQKLRVPASNLYKAGPNVQSWIREAEGKQPAQGSYRQWRASGGEEVPVFTGDPHVLMDCSTPMSVEAAPDSTQWVTEQNINRHES